MWSRSGQARHERATALRDSGKRPPAEGGRPQATTVAGVRVRLATLATRTPELGTRVAGADRHRTWRAASRRSLSFLFWRSNRWSNNGVSGENRSRLACEDDCEPVLDELRRGHRAPRHSRRRRIHGSRKSARWCLAGHLRPSHTWSVAIGSPQIAAEHQILSDRLSLDTKGSVHVGASRLIVLDLGLINESADSKPARVRLVGLGRPVEAMSDAVPGRGGYRAEVVYRRFEFDTAGIGGEAAQLRAGITAAVLEWVDDDGEILAAVDLLLSVDDASQVRIELDKPRRSGLLGRRFHVHVDNEGSTPVTLQVTSFVPRGEAVVDHVAIAVLGDDLHAAVGGHHPLASRLLRHARLLCPNRLRRDQMAEQPAEQRSRKMTNVGEPQRTRPLVKGS